MKAKIIKIDPLKSSRSEKSYRRIYFTLEDGSFAKTDIVPAYRNYKNWKSIIDLVDGLAIIFVDGLKLRQKGEVDADSPVEITLDKFEIRKVQEKKIIQQSLL
jgi:hypothetical protein